MDSKVSRHEEANMSKEVQSMHKQWTVNVVSDNAQVPNAELNGADWCISLGGSRLAPCK